MILEKAILTNQTNNGALYCNAVDEDPYDSSEWHNRMPANSIDFATDEYGNVITTYTYYFACYDGWDSDYEIETHHDMQSAVNSAWLLAFPHADRCPTLIN